MSWIILLVPEIANASCMFLAYYYIQAKYIGLVWAEEFMPSELLNYNPITQPVFMLQATLSPFIGL